MDTKILRSVTRMVIGVTLTSGLAATARATLTEQKLTASDGAKGDQFGASVSFDGDAIVVGALGTTITAARRAQPTCFAQLSAAASYAAAWKISLYADGSPTHSVASIAPRSSAG